MAAPTIQAQGSPFLKQLADSKLKTRTTALDNLRVYLRAHHRFTHLELLKLWKGLFYCMWMQDRPKAQQRLAVELSSLVEVLAEENVLPFLEAFWKTMAREWNSIDILRMDKFMYLVRQYLAASFRYLSRNDWSNGHMVQQYMNILSTTPLNPTDARLPDGLRYHLLDIYVDELERAGSEQNSGMPLEALLQPIERMKEQSVTKSLRKQARETMEDERLKHVNGVRNDEAAKSPAEELRKNGNNVNLDVAEDDEEWGGFED